MKKEKFQFQIDGRAFSSPLRDTWREAVQDAVNDGYAVWVKNGFAKFDDQAAIARVYVTTP